MTVTRKIHFKQVQRGRKTIKSGAAATPVLNEYVPRIARLMALAIKLDGMLQRGEVKDYAEIARLGHVTRARMTQIMNLLNLAPDIQEELLFVHSVATCNTMKEWKLRRIAALTCWGAQHTLLKRLTRRRSPVPYSA